MEKVTTRTENGAIAYVTSGSNFIDQFGIAGNHRGRSYQHVAAEQSLLWDENPVLAIRFPFYLRMITRKIKLINKDTTTATVQNGQGARDESFMRLLWIAKNHPKAFYEHLAFLPLVGSWKDLWTLMCLDETVFGVNNAILNRENIYTLMKVCLDMETHAELIKKYMPRINSYKKATTPRAKQLRKFALEFANVLGLSVAKYNKLKASGKAHVFQQLISQEKYDELEWGKIPGKALNLLATGKFLKNHKLDENFLNWLDTQDSVKFNGYPYELYHQATSKGKLSFIEKYTINKQFNQLIATAKENDNIKGNIWCALDTSGSMITEVIKGISAIEISNSLGIFFSTLNEGAFHKHVIMFDDYSRAKKLNGDFCDMIKQIPRDSMGSTNFQSVVDEIVRIREHNPNIPLSDYPTTLLVVSDMEFNPVQSRYWMVLKASEEDTKTNYEAMKEKLLAVFPQDFVDNMKFIWWNVASRTKHVPATMEDGGCYLFSGFDGSIVTMLLGLEEKVDEKGNRIRPTMEEIVTAALNQEIFTYFSDVL